MSSVTVEFSKREAVSLLKNAAIASVDRNYGMAAEVLSDKKLAILVTNVGSGEWITETKTPDSIVFKIQWTALDTEKQD